MKIIMVRSALEFKRLAGKLKAMSHPGRLRLLAELMEGECCVGDVQRCLNLSQPHVSQSLNVLKKAGIVAGRRQGTRICYRIVDPLTKSILKKLIFEERKK
jgi:DNA-binding transcriptional ArsR family regulator